MMKRITFLFVFLFSIGMMGQMPDFSQGTFILNEGAFGSDPASLNFVDDEFDFHENVYQSINGSRFGNTGSFATIFADKLFVVSKQVNATEGGILVVADAQTLEELVSIDQIGNAQGRSFVGVSPEKGYLGTTDGIYLFDLNDLELDGQLTEVNSGEIGNMIRSSKYIYAVKANTGVLVIDGKTDELIETISGDYNAVVQAQDGSIWTITQNELVKIDESDFTTTEYGIPTTTYPEPWFAWHAGSFSAAITENSLYWLREEGFGYGQEIIKFDIDTESFDENFAEIPGNGDYDAYGAGLRIDPKNGNLVVVSVGANYDFATNRIHFLDSEGSVLQTVEPEDYNWFPALAFFPDVESPEVLLPEEISLNLNEEIIIDLRDQVSDGDNNSMAIVKTLISNSNSDAVEAIVNDDEELVINHLAEGNATLEIGFDSNGKTVVHTIEITFDEEVELSEEDVVFFVGEGDQTAYVLVDFRDDTADASFAWGVRFDENDNQTILNALEMIQEEDPNFSFVQTGGFLNDIIYNHHEGLDSMPDWWSTWDGESLSTMEMNMGISGALSNGNWYGFSYGFMPEPQTPRFIYAAYNSEWFGFEDVESWFGEGENQAIITIDFVEDSTEEEVTFAWGLKFVEESISGKTALEILADADEDLEVIFDDENELISINYDGLSKTINQNENWKAFIGNTLSDYAPAEVGIMEMIADGKMFGVSFGGELVRRPFIPTVVENPGMGVDRIDLENQIKVWPNPVSDILQISLPGNVELLTVYDMQGRAVLQSKTNEINVQQLSPGNYLLQIQTEGSVYTKRFIKR